MAKKRIRKSRARTGKRPRTRRSTGKRLRTRKRVRKGLRTGKRERKISGGMEGGSKCLGRCIETYNHHLDTLLQSMNSKGRDEETLQYEFDDICDEISKNPKDPDAIEELKKFIKKHNAFVETNQLEITGILLLLAHDINPSSKGLIKLDVIKDEDLLKILQNFIDKITLSVLKESLSKLPIYQWDDNGILYFMVQSYLEDLEKSTRTDKSTSTAARE